MLPEFPDFKEIEISDGDVIRHAVQRAGMSLNEFSFTNLIVWRDFDRATCTLINGNLCIKVSPLNEPPFFLEPIGPNDIATAEICMKHTGRISRASASFVSHLPPNTYRVQMIPEHFDYIYRTADLAKLKGRLFDSKRNHIRRFMNRCPSYRYEELGTNLAKAALKLYDDWCLAKRHSPANPNPHEIDYSCQRRAIERAFEDYTRLKIVSGALISDGELIGYVIGSQLRGDMACLHFCYGRSDLPGLYQMLIREACRNTFSSFEFINFEQDLGLAGLRKFKRSYHPVRFEEKFEVELNGGGNAA